MNKDEVKTHQQEEPTADYYEIFNNKDGSTSYYKHTPEFSLRCRLIYGTSTGRWSYTNHEATHTH
jgi:hypothetical protein